MKRGKRKLFPSFADRSRLRWVTYQSDLHREHGNISLELGAVKVARPVLAQEVFLGNKDIDSNS